MAGFTAQGATFTFVGSVGTPFSGAVVGVSVETPVAEVIDMTSPQNPTGYAVLVPTGDWTGGSVTVDYISTSQTGDIQSLVRGVGQLTFASETFSVSRRAILESATQEVKVGDLVRGSMKFRMTDYQGA